MKKIAIALSVIGVFLAIMPMKVSAVETTKNNTNYGTITVDETPWSSSNPIVTQVYYVTKSFPGGYVYIMINPVKNVDNVRIVYSSTVFSKVSEVKNSNGSISVLLRTKDGKAISGKTELLTAIADGSDKIPDEGCELGYSPLSVSCLHIDDVYIDKSGNEVTAEEFNKVCNNANPNPNNPNNPNNPDDPNDVPNSDTGSVIPYIAVGGGLLAIAGVYFISKKSNKMYKI